MRAVPQAAIDFLKLHEACVLRVYDDANPARVLAPGDRPEGKLTSGYGHTGFVYVGTEITKAKADSDLFGDISDASAKLASVVDRAVIDALTENQYSALLSFVFNIGAGAGWTIWKVLNAKHFDQVPLEMMRFVNADGKKLQGLVNRRAAEVALWATGEPGTVEANPPSSVTRAIDTQPTPADPIPASKSKTIISSVVSAVATVPVAVKQVSDAISPYAEHSHFVANIVAGLGTVAAAAVVLTLIFAWLHKRNARN